MWVVVGLCWSIDFDVVCLEWGLRLCFKFFFFGVVGVVGKLCFESRVLMWGFYVLVIKR